MQKLNSFDSNDSVTFNRDVFLKFFSKREVLANIFYDKLCDSFSAIDRENFRNELINYIKPNDDQEYAKVGFEQILIPDENDLVYHLTAECWDSVNSCVMPIIFVLDLNFNRTLRENTILMNKLYYVYSKYLLSLNSNGISEHMHTPAIVVASAYNFEHKKYFIGGSLEVSVDIVDRYSCASMDDDQINYYNKLLGFNLSQMKIWIAPIIHNDPVHDFINSYLFGDLSKVGFYVSDAITNDSRLLASYVDQSRF